MVCGSVDAVYEQIDPGNKGIVSKENFLILVGMLGIPSVRRNPVCGNSILY